MTLDQAIQNGPYLRPMQGLVGMDLSVMVKNVASEPQRFVAYFDCWDQRAYTAKGFANKEKQPGTGSFVR